jgi:hypothetical protein
MTREKTKAQHLVVTIYEGVHFPDVEEKPNTSRLARHKEVIETAWDHLPRLVAEVSLCLCVDKYGIASVIKNRTGLCDRLNEGD